MGLYSEYLFPPLADWMVRSMGGARAKLLADLSGEVLEIGCGGGLSFEFYPPAVERLYALEPSPAMRHRAGRRWEALRSGQPGKGPQSMDLIEASAEQIPFPESRFDAAVSFLTLCTVNRPRAVLREIHRVLKPGGRLFFFEHILHPDPGFLRSYQIVLNPFWRLFSCGCNLQRPTADWMEAEGFRFERIEHLDSPKVPRLVSHIIRGAALKTGG